MIQSNEKVKPKRFARYSARDIRKFPFVYAIIAFPLIQIIVFYFYINFSAILMAFKDAEGNWGMGSVKAVTDAFVSGTDRSGYKMWDMFFKSIIPWGIDNIFAFIVNLFLAFVLTKHMAFSKTLRLIYFIPGIVGSVIFTTIMKEMYAYNGIVTNALKSMGIKLPTFAVRNGLLGAEETAFKTLMIQRALFQIAGGNIILAGAYMKIPQEIFESSQLEGCGFLREIFQIAIPCIWPTISTMFIFSICSILTYDYGAYLYSNGTGANGITSIGFYLYNYQVKISENPDRIYLYGYISAFGIIVTILTMILVFVTRKIASKLQDEVSF